MDARLVKERNSELTRPSLHLAPVMGVLFSVPSYRPDDTLINTSASSRGSNLFPGSVQKPCQDPAWGLFQRMASLHVLTQGLEN